MSPPRFPFVLVPHFFGFNFEELEDPIRVVQVTNWLEWSGGRVFG